MNFIFIYDVMIMLGYFDSKFVDLSPSIYIPPFNLLNLDQCW